MGYYGLREERQLGARLALRIAALFPQAQWAAAAESPGGLRCAEQVRAAQAAGPP